MKFFIVFIFLLCPFSKLVALDPTLNRQVDEQIKKQIKIQNQGKTGNQNSSITTKKKKKKPRSSFLNLNQFSKGSVEEKTTGDVQKETSKTNVVSTSGDVVSNPDNARSASDNVVSNPDNARSASDNVVSNPDNARSTSDDVVSIPDITKSNPAVGGEGQSIEIKIGEPNAKGPLSCLTSTEIVPLGLLHKMFSPEGKIFRKPPEVESSENGYNVAFHLNSFPKTDCFFPEVVMKKKGNDIFLVL